MVIAKMMDERSRKEGKDQAKNKENERLWLEKETTLSSNIQELEERMKSAVDDAERYGSKAREMDGDDAGSAARSCTNICTQLLTAAYFIWLRIRYICTQYFGIVTSSFSMVIGC